MCFSKQKLASLTVILELTCIPVQGGNRHMELCCSPTGEHRDSSLCGATAPVPHQPGEQEAASKSKQTELCYSVHSTYSTVQKTSWKQTSNRWQVYAESREASIHSKTYCCLPCFLPSFNYMHGEKWTLSIWWQTGVEHAPSCSCFMYLDGMNESLVMSALGLSIRRA